MTDLIRDLTDDEARVALPYKWGTVDPGVLPAWVADMDFAAPEPIVDALHRAVSANRFGYPRLRPASGGELGRTYSAFAERQYQLHIDPDLVVPVVDVTAGIRLALDVLCDPGPVVIPVPAYAPHLDIAQITGRARADLVLDPSAPRAELDLEQLDGLFRSGARTLLLTQPHNPWGRVFTKPELEGIRDVVVRHGGRVISDEIHAPLVLPGAKHESYLSIDGTEHHAVALVSASKAFNLAGLRCAQIVTVDPKIRDRLANVPIALNDSWSSLGEVATVAAYTDCDDWLAAVVARLDDQRALLNELLATHLPSARQRPLEASYLVWLDLRAYGHRDPAKIAAQRGRIRVSAGHDYHPGLDGHIRVNIATSSARLTEIIRRLAGALTAR